MCGSEAEPSRCCAQSWRSEVKSALLAIVLAFTSLGLQACRMTEVALVTIRNETSVGVRLRAGLNGRPPLDPAMHLGPGAEDILLRYEEPRYGTPKVPDYIDSLEITVESCRLELGRIELERLAFRKPDVRHWTFRIRRELLDRAGCLSGTQVRRRHSVNRPGSFAEVIRRTDGPLSSRRGSEIR